MESWKDGKAKERLLEKGMWCTKEAVYITKEKVHVKYVYIVEQGTL